MPYIAQEQRHKLDPSVDRLAQEIREYFDGNNTSVAGILNYTITTLVLKAMEPQGYHDVALVTGVLENVKQEFYRKFASPYEEQKIKENGPVYDE